jgi:protein-S-isoprenylcysteine O-methyltransferase Ste14
MASLRSGQKSYKSRTGCYRIIKHPIYGGVYA